MFRPDPHRAAADDYAVDPGGNLSWVVVGRRVDKAFRVEQHEVCAQALPDASAVGETDALRCAACQAGHRFLGWYELLLEGVSPQSACGGAVKSGMGPLPEDAVGAHELQGVAEDGPYRLLGGVVVDHRHVELRLLQKIEGRDERIAAPLVGYLGERLTEGIDA